MKPKTLRNAQIARMYMYGVPVKTIAHYFSVSETIVKKIAQRLGMRRHRWHNHRLTNQQLELPLTFSRGMWNGSSGPAVNTKLESEKSSTNTANLDG